MNPAANQCGVCPPSAAAASAGRVVPHSRPLRAPRLQGVSFLSPCNHGLGMSVPRHSAQATYRHLGEAPARNPRGLSKVVGQPAKVAGGVSPGRRHEVNMRAHTSSDIGHANGREPNSQSNVQRKNRVIPCIPCAGVAPSPSNLFLAPASEGLHLTFVQSVPCEHFPQLARWSASAGCRAFSFGGQG